MNKLFIDSVFQQIFHWLAIYKHWFENCYINEFINFSFLLPRDELQLMWFKKKNTLQGTKVCQNQEVP